MKRRDFLRNAGLGTAAVALHTLTTPGTAAALLGEEAGTLTDAGAGVYTDPSVAGMLSYFTINRSMISCGVGQTIAFAMLMYATDIESYTIDHGARSLRATGRMRSITITGGLTMEDIEHDFIAIALDRGATKDRFDVHFSTPFWCRFNPMCAPSDVHPGWCRFGGQLIVDSNGKQVGGVVVGP